MTYEEMKAYIANMVKSQGSQGAIAIAPLLYAMADKMFADPETGVVPIVVSIAEVGNKEGTATRYDITTDQQTINEYIDNVTEEKAKARLFIQDGDALIGFTYLEINGTTITGQSIAPDENSIQPGSGTITITVHPDVNNNINNNSSWGNVRALLQEKTYITIQSATA